MSLELVRWSFRLVLRCHKCQNRASARQSNNDWDLVLLLVPTPQPLNFYKLPGSQVFRCFEKSRIPCSGKPSLDDLGTERGSPITSTEIPRRSACLQQTANKYTRHHLHCKGLKTPSQQVLIVTSVHCQAVMMWSVMAEDPQPNIDRKSWYGHLRSLWQEVCITERRSHRVSGFDSNHYYRAQSPLVSPVAHQLYRQRRSSLVVFYKVIVIFGNYDSVSRMSADQSTIESQWDSWRCVTSETIRTSLKVTLVSKSNHTSID